MRDYKSNSVREALRLNIRRHREQRGLSQQDLADELEIDVSGICNLENGRRELRATELPILATLFGIEIAELFR